MKKHIQSFLAHTPSLYRIVERAYSLRRFRFRIVPLSRHRITPDRIQELEHNPNYNGIIDDLIAYTGFSKELLFRYLMRLPKYHFESEYNWYRPTNELELTWFYRSNFGYLFANSIHPYAEQLNTIPEGRVLDYGAGVGCNTLGLARRGLSVDFLEINRLQADFINFRAERHSLINIKEVPPYAAGRFDPLKCIINEYDAIIAMDVLEHIPKYHRVVEHFIRHLKPGGLIIENSPFDQSADDIAIHVRADVPLEKAMAGMERIACGIWKKI